MEPDFHNGQYLLVNKISYHFGSPNRGDVIIFRYPLDTEKIYIKRVIGLPGEIVEIKNGQIYINDKRLDEPDELDEIDYERNANYGPVQVPEDSYFVLGDNRPDSSDSRGGWYVPAENIVGKVWLCYWPPGEWGLSPAYSATLK